MQIKSHRSITLIVTVLVVVLLVACGPSSSSDAGAGVDDQSGDGDAANPTWQYKMSVITNFGKSNALQENGTVVFDGTFSVLPSGAIESHEGNVTVTGSYRCREVNSDPPKMLEGKLDGGHSFSVNGRLIPAEDYNEFNIFPLEPLTVDEAKAEYALISMPKVDDRDRVAISFGRENCTGSDFTPVIAEVISFGEIPFFNAEYFPFFVVSLDPQATFLEQIELNDEGSQVLSKAELCIAPAGKCP
jgi:hypothetical protein